MSNNFHIEYVNESSMLIRFENDDTIECAVMLAEIAEFVNIKFGCSITDVIFSYTTLLISVNTQRLSLAEFKNNLESSLQRFLFDRVGQKEVENHRAVIRIPVFYHALVAPDLKAVADYAELSVDELIQAHCSKIYFVCAIGFSPGFAYLGEVDKKIAKSRLESPRLVVPKGSVGIAGVQTGVYPEASPGGWNIIGRTPLAMLMQSTGSNIKSRVNAGERVEFFSINQADFLAMGGHF